MSHWQAWNCVVQAWVRVLNAEFGKGETLQCVRRLPGREGRQRWSHNSDRHRQGGRGCRGDAWRSAHDRTSPRWRSLVRPNSLTLPMRARLGLGDGAVSSNAPHRDMGRAWALLRPAIGQPTHRKVLETSFETLRNALRQKIRCRASGNFVPSTPFTSMTAAIFAQRSVQPSLEEPSCDTELSVSCFSAHWLPARRRRRRRRSQPRQRPRQCRRRPHRLSRADPQRPRVRPVQHLVLTPRQRPSLTPAFSKLAPTASPRGRRRHASRKQASPRSRAWSGMTPGSGVHVACATGRPSTSRWTSAAVSPPVQASQHFRVRAALPAPEVRPRFRLPALRRLLAKAGVTLEQSGEPARRPLPTTAPRITPKRIRT